MKRVTLVLDGRSYDVTMETDANGQQTVTVSGQTFPITSVTRDAGAHRRVQVAVAGAPLVEVERLDLTQVRVDDLVSTYRIDSVSHGPGAGIIGAEGAQIRPPMPGKIVSIKVEVGDAVAAGDVLLVLEAMKMQNEVASPADGIVTEVRVHDGATVDTPDVLIVLGPRDDQGPGNAPKEVTA